VSGMVCVLQLIPTVVGISWETPPTGGWWLRLPPAIGRVATIGLWPMVASGNIYDKYMMMMSICICVDDDEYGYSV